MIDSGQSLNLKNENLTSGNNFLIHNSFVNQSKTWPDFQKIFVSEESIGSPVVSNFQKIYPPARFVYVTKGSEAELFLNRKGSLSAEEFDQSKKWIWLTEYKGHFFKRCPGASQKKTLSCCNYHILNLGSQCNMNCSYCYLQSYLNAPTMKVYTNIDKALIELSEMADLHSDQPFRVGTGEVIDSLSIDEVTLYSKKLISFFNKYPKWTLEFKTKSNKVDQFLDVVSAGNTVVSWSINPSHIIENEEHGTASFDERIAAAKKCLAKGFKIAFHIDPMIWHPEWKENYSQLAELLNYHFMAEDVHIISLGTLRFQPEQRHMMRERFGMNSYVTSAEMFQSEGDKLRYDSGLRSEMFHFMVQKMKSFSSKWNIFLCMETPETWIKSLEKTPSQIPELKSFFKPLPQF